MKGRTIQNNEIVSLGIECPYNINYKELKLIRCELGMLKFPNKCEKNQYINRYCKSVKGCEECTLHKQLTEYYERQYAPEPEKPREKMIIGVLP